MRIPARGCLRPRVCGTDWQTSRNSRQLAKSHIHGLRFARTAALRRATEKMVRRAKVAPPKNPGRRVGGEPLDERDHLIECPRAFKSDNGTVSIETSGGRVEAEPGDCIIKDSAGVLRLCKPDAFEVSCEPMKRRGRGWPRPQALSAS
jgi:hypothetical protein